MSDPGEGREEEEEEGRGEGRGEEVGEPGIAMLIGRQLALTMKNEHT